MRRFILLFAVLACVTPCFRAEDLVLIDGRYLHVKILVPSERGLQVQLLDTGGQVFLPWGLISEPYRTLKMIEYGYGTEEKILVEEGNRITTKAGDTWEGRIVSETADEMTLKSRGKEMTLKKALVREVEKLSVNVLEIYAAEEYYNKRAGEMKVPDDDIQGNMELADLCFAPLGLYEKSFLHYKKVQAVDPGYQTTLIENRLKTLEELSKNKQIRDLLDDARKNMMFHQFVKSATQIEAVLALKDLPPTLKNEADILKARCIKMRYDWFRVIVRDQYELTLRNKIRAMSRDDKLKLDEARRKLRADLHKEVVLDLATRLQLDPKEVEKMWEERGWNQARTASYGSGSFIVLGRAPNADKYDAEMQKYLQAALRSQQQQQGKNNQNGSLSAQPEKLPKPPTKEEWWTKISISSDREGWMLAFWAENSKKVKVVGDRWEDCSRCGGTGALKFAGSQGDTLRTTCPTCQGHQRHKGVAFK